ncbi:FAD-dependent oxidoreductase [Chlorobaculum sp. MV4-Y]|uniref:FAD-dependent oxidoreductase n=1 Tax=Chlorobaculum sp. MV4-Y TaxID=2976335 RepID=UPI0021AF14C2|nr:FAD-dependent oxidoreductase [Chlorobaculum sp. MV4-Y]UWX58274.1 FAD-dependent oxidoreductase [Chlorobaculum sp. MV4-Y]
MHVAIIGGGISGIAAAFYLAQQHVSVDLFESENQIGGRAGSDFLQERRVDFGGKNIGRNYLLFREFARAYGDPAFEYFGINTSQLVNGRIVSISREGSVWLNLLKIIRLCGFRKGITRLYPHIQAILNDRSQGVLCSDYFRALSENFDHLALDRHLNQRCIERVIRPITIRMNGAEPEECYPGNFGSNLALALDSFEQLTVGMYDLLNTFVVNHRKDSSLRILTSHRVTSIAKDRDKFRINYLHGATPGTESYDRVISALPAYSLAELLQDELPEASKLLNKISYFPVGIAIVKYRDEVFPKNRRAMVFERNSPLSNAGAYGLNDLDIVRYTFSGKASRTTISEQSSPEKVIKLGEKIASPYFNIKENPKEAFVFRYFTKGLCAYSPKHHLLLEKTDHLVNSLSGLGITGDYRRGASIEACFRAAKECVEKVIGDGS